MNIYLSMLLSPATPTLQTGEATHLFKNFSLEVHLESNQLQIRQ